jgi:hypothetical protein
MQDTRRDLKLFNWHKETRTLTAFISDLNIPGQLPFHITIDNPTTKESRVFRYVRTEKDPRENELKAYHYENLSHGLKLTIWND